MKRSPGAAARPVPVPRAPGVPTPGVATPGAVDPRAAEARLCATLGIPADAPQVLIVCETSHWDPQWLLTSSEYFRLAVDRHLARALDELERAPRRVYGLECVFFLRRFWEAHPERHAQLVRLVGEGRLRLLGSGVTTPDTVVTHGEGILRDYLCGQEWLREHGLAAEPGVAFLPDSFGHSPALPSLLAALGVHAVALARVDGMYFPGTDHAGARSFPRLGSTAMQLLQGERSLDAIWRDAAGAEVLLSWMAFGYGMGDLLGHRGLTRWMGLPLAVRARAPRRISRQLDAFAARLAPLARTRYRLCPVGFDFAPPIPGLIDLLDGHNQRGYQDGGVWAVNTGYDDYAALVGAHRDVLPTVTIDPNPCFSGFAASRPELKHAYQRTMERLLAADALAAQALGRGRTPSLAERDALRELWYRASVVNHHDFVTGTSTDRVVRREQAPALAALAADIDRHLPGPEPARPPAAAPARRARPGAAVLERRSSRWEVVVDPATGGSLARWFDRARGRACAAAGALAIGAYRDDGGLWRLGHELQGGRFRPVDLARRAPARVDLAEHDDTLVITLHSTIRGLPLERELTLEPDGRARLRVTAAAPRGYSLTLRIPGVLQRARLRTEVPGGSALRPLRRLWSPTFWPVSGLVTLRDADGQGLCFAPVDSAAVAVDEHGSLEWLVARHAPRERAPGQLPLWGFPVRHRHAPAHTAEATLALADPADLDDGDARRAAGRARAEALLGAPLATWRAACLAAIALDRDDVEVVALKPAWRGEGVIVRLRASRAGGPLRLAAFTRTITHAWRCDARERDLEPLAVEGRTVLVPELAPITTLRLCVDAGAGESS